MKHYYLYTIDPIGRLSIDGVYDTEDEASEALDFADGAHGPAFDIGIAEGIDELNKLLMRSYEAVY